MDVTCSHCGTRVPDTYRFCTVCGARMGTVPPPVAPPTVGTAPAVPFTLLAGRYTVDRVLGRGGMSTVYRAYDTRFSNRVVAVKEMVDSFATPEERAEATRDFLREADMLAALRHPAIPAVFDRFSVNARHYLVMEHIEGENMEEAVHARTVPFPEPQVRTWALELCALLRYLHEQQPPVIFRDLKPGNILIDPSGRLRLIDFGIARFFKQTQSTDTTALGTSGYASPEHYTGQTDARSDIYSLGATLHHLLTLRDPSRQPPFQFPPVRGLNPTVSPELEAIIGRALATDRAARFGGAREMEAALVARPRAPRARTGPMAIPPPLNPRAAQPGPPTAALPVSGMTPCTLVLVITRLGRGLNARALAEEMAPLIGKSPLEAVELLRRLPVVTPLVSVHGLGGRLKRLRDLGTDARHVAPATESVHLDPALMRELLTHHQIVIWDVRVGAGRTCYCRRCGHRWVTSKAVGDFVPKECNRCKRDDWSKRRLCKCAWCGHEFEVNDYESNPERLRPFCECCGLRDWLLGRPGGWQGWMRSFRALLGLPG
ncbi:MAG: protein kinase domain-containing protein [Chloroflexota bacterium]